MHSCLFKCKHICPRYLSPVSTTEPLSRRKKNALKIKYENCPIRIIAITDIQTFLVVKLKAVRWVDLSVLCVMKFKKAKKKWVSPTCNLKWKILSWRNVAKEIIPRCGCAQSVSGINLTWNRGMNNVHRRRLPFIFSLFFHETKNAASGKKGMNRKKRIDGKMVEHKFNDERFQPRLMQWR